MVLSVLQRVALLVGLFCCSACTTPGQSVEVERTWIRIAPPTDLLLTAADVRLRGVSLERCTSGAEWVELEVELNLLDPEPLEVFGGDWCAAVLDLDLFVFNGQGPDGGTFSLHVDAPDVRLDAASRTIIDADPLVLELGYPGWIHPDLVGVSGGSHVVVDSSHASHERASDALRMGSALYADSTPDGLLDRFESSQDPIAAGAHHPSVREPDPRFVAVGDDGRWVDSVDGSTWYLDEHDAVDTDPLVSVTRTADRWVAVGGGVQARSMTTTDLDRWVESSGGGRFNDTAYGDGRVVAVGVDGRRSWSYDGVVWRDVEVHVVLDYHAVAWADGRFVAVGAEGARSTSVNAQDWTEPVLGGEALNDVVWGGGVFVAVGDNARRITSVDGSFWELDLAGGEPLDAVAHGDTGFLATGAGLVMTSVDATEWAVVTEDAPALTSVAWGSAVFVGLGAGGRYVSSDAESWELVVPADDPPLLGVSFGE